MRAAFALTHIGVFRHLEGVARELCRRGHSVDVILGDHGRKSVAITERAIDVCVAELPRCEASRMLARRDGWRHAIFTARELKNYSIYLRPGHPSSAWSHRWRTYLPRSWPVVSSPLFKKCLALGAVQGALRRAEHFVPPCEEIVDWLREKRPDVLVASMYVCGNALEVEYVKAAKALGIPTVVAVASWDNLTNKGTFQMIPDLTIVWNSALLAEAVELHGLPRARVLITGAPAFDCWFEMTPSLTRQQFCDRVGINPSDPYVVYLCSSKAIARDETALVAGLARQLRARSTTERIAVLVRPHPLNAEIWDQFQMDNVRVWPVHGDVPDSPGARSDYYHTLYHSLATVGVNTSAMLESAIVDRPCITVMSESQGQGQEEWGHFRHLLNGGFMQVTYGFEEAVGVVEAIARGGPLGSGERRHFVEEFVRPRGLTRPVAPIAATAVELVAAGKSQAEIDAELSGIPA